VIGFIGGTGPEGRGLALRLARAGEKILLGSRDIERAAQAVNQLSTHVPPGSISASTNNEVAQRSDPIFIAVPYEGHRSTLSDMSGLLAHKTIVDVVAPVTFRKGVAHAIPVPEGSAAEEAQTILPNSIIVAAFHTISAHDLLDPNMSINSDVIVCSDNYNAKQLGIHLAGKIEGVRGIDGGELHNASYVENLTALLLNINKIYKTRSAIRISGI